jgi:flagellar basal-body rod protein FlgB
MTNKIDNYLGLHADAINLRSRRARLLADNLANADTPNYKARDLDFKDALSQARQNSGATMQQTHASHLPLAGSLNAEPLYRVPQQASLDGNTVDNHVEQGKFADNAVRYQASLQILNQRITGLIRVLRSE